MRKSQLIAVALLAGWHLSSMAQQGVERPGPMPNGAQPAIPPAANAREYCQGDPSRCGQDRLARIQERFRRADADSNGALSRQEAEQSMRGVARHFDVIDANRDGHVTQDEIVAWRTQRMQRVQGMQGREAMQGMPGPQGRGMQDPYGMPGPQGRGMQDPYAAQGMPGPQGRGMQDPYGMQGPQGRGMQDPYGMPGPQGRGIQDPHSAQSMQGPQGRGAQRRESCNSSPEQCLAQREARITERFRKADGDGNGALSRAEAEQSMRGIARRFDTVDANRDGHVTVDEILAFRRTRTTGQGQGPAVNAPPRDGRGVPPSAVAAPSGV